MTLGRHGVDFCTPDRRACEFGEMQNSSSKGMPWSHLSAIQVLARWVEEFHWMEANEELRLHNMAGYFYCHRYSWKRLWVFTKLLRSSPNMRYNKHRHNRSLGGQNVELTRHGVKLLTIGPIR